MEQTTDFITRIDRSLAGDGLRSLRRAVEAGHAGMPRDASLMEEARLIVCLEGTAWFQLQRGDGTTEVELKPGEALFVGPGRWVKANPRQPYMSMGIVFYGGSTRFYLMHGKPTRVGAPVETCVMPAALGEDGRGLVRMLAGSAPAVAGERYFRNAAECLLIAARDLLTTPPGEAPGKARFTWQAACDYIADNLQRPLSRKDVARFLRVHPNHLSRLFAEFSREPFALYLQDRRIERARLLMADPRLNISEVARLSGFASANYFIRVFRQRTGHTPTRARRKDV